MGTASSQASISGSAHGVLRISSASASLQPGSAPNLNWAMQSDQGHA
jgi:hypothetical protein